MNFVDNINDLAKQNANFRKELVTGENSQVVLMSLMPQEEIGEEVHRVDQIIVIVDGVGEAILDGERSNILSGFLVFVPAGAKHNIVNTGVSDLKLFTIYAPAQHKPGTIHSTKAEAADEEEY